MQTISIPKILTLSSTVIKNSKDIFNMEHSYPQKSHMQLDYKETTNDVAPSFSFFFFQKYP